jgi:nuclear transport factor 2 (NTF2) superfamily protein
MITSETARPPVPPFDRNAAIKKVRLAEDAWNTRDPEKVASGYTPRQLVAQSLGVFLWSGGDYSVSQA